MIFLNQLRMLISVFRQCTLFVFIIFFFATADLVSVEPCFLSVVHQSIYRVSKGAREWFNWVLFYNTISNLSHLLFSMFFPQIFAYSIHSQTENWAAQRNERKHNLRDKFEKQKVKWLQNIKKKNIFCFLLHFAFI